jgi:AraC-like DNA-binding protein
MYDRSAVRLSLIHALPTAAEATGVAVGPLLSLGGLEPHAFGDRDRIARRSQIITVMNGLARQSGDPTIGLQMAASTDPALLGPFGRSLLVGRTVGEALALQQRHMPWLQHGTSISMDILGATARWTHRMHGCDPAKARFLTEGIAAFFVRFVRAASGDEGARLHVVLPHKPAAPVSIHEDALRCAVQFDRDADLEIRFDAALLQRRNRLRIADEAEPSALNGGAVPMSIDLTDAQLLSSLGRMIEVAILRGRFTLADAAVTLGLSPRGLQRRLAQLDTSFERMVDDWRHGLALELLSDPVNGTSEIANRLGYADPSHFIRAFRRWQGMSPMAFSRGLA